MARLIAPAGTVVECGDTLAVSLRARGWRDADAPVEPVKATPEKPTAPKRARTRKTTPTE